MNRYYVTFVFQGGHYFVNFSANRLANELLGDTDDIAEFKYQSNPSQYEPMSFRAKDGHEYDVDFTIGNPYALSVYNPADNGFVVEKDIPWQIIKVTNEDGEKIFDITDEI